MADWLNVLFTEWRYSLRAVRKNGLFAASLSGIFTLAIASATVVYGVVGVLFLPSVIGNTERLGWVFGIDTGRANDRAGVSMLDFLDFRERAHAFESLAARATGTLTLTGRGQATKLSVMRVTANHLDVWGFNAFKGRTFLPGEDLPGAGRVVMVSHRMWQSRLGGDESIIGGALTLDGAPHTVIGVLEPRIDVGSFAAIDLWAPLNLAAGPHASRESRGLAVVGLLKPTVALEQAHQEIRTIAQHLQKENPATNAGWDARVVDTWTGRTGPQTYYNAGLLGMGAALVLLIACVNAALLLLARSLMKQREVSVRLALGATSFRVVRQQVCEGMTLAIPGVALGLALALTVIGRLKAWGDAYYQRISVDWNLFLFAAAIALLLPAIFAAVPALQLARRRVPLTPASSAEALTGAAGRRRQRVLVITQLGAALMLLVVSGLVLRSLVASMRADLGFNTKDLLSVALDLPAWKYPERDRLPQFFSSLLESVTALPDVTGAGAMSSVPALQLLGPFATVAFEGSSHVDAAARPSVQVGTVTPNVFRTLEVPVVTGREFSSHDQGNAPLVAIVNVQFASKFSPDPRQILGRKLAVRGEARWREIVGVVGNVRAYSNETFPPSVYLPHSQDPQRTMYLLVRMPNRVSVMAVKDAIGAADSDVAPYQIRTIEEGLGTQQFGRIILFGLFGTLAVVAAVLAVFGLFGVFSCFVAQRNTEFGIRLALGATNRQLRQTILREGLLTMLPGIAIGLLGGALLSRYAVGVIYGVTADPYDPTVYVLAGALLTLSGVAALWPPARRAERIGVTGLLRN